MLFLCRMKRVFLAKGKERALERRHPWVFSGAIQRSDKSISEGDWVEVCSSAGQVLALGHYQNENASIRVKILSFEENAQPKGLIEKHIAKACEYRKAEGFSTSSDHHTNAFRLVFGEGDSLPGLIVDFYNGTAVVQCHTTAMFLNKDSIVNGLKLALGEDLIAVYNKSAESLHNDSISNGWWYGESDNHIALENGVKFYIDWIDGQKTGFFIDQRENRKRVGERSKDKKVLNVFSYTGGFSLYALQAGAREVHSVDISARACELADKNAELNGWSSKHTSHAKDVFEFLKEMDEDFDVVILDPPAFAKRRNVTHNAIQAYKRINAMALSKMKSGSWLYTFSCSQNISHQMFVDTVRAAAIETGKKIKLAEHLHQPTDHPIDIYLPEGEYLKGLVVYIE